MSDWEDRALAELVRRGWTLVPESGIPRLTGITASDPLREVLADVARRRQEDAIEENGRLRSVLARAAEALYYLGPQACCGADAHLERCEAHLTVQAIKRALA